jgi:MoaA/NifB/PqqE/SkfB family radical SAM enzyme
MFDRAFVKRLFLLWRDDRDNLFQKIRKKLRNKYPLDVFWDASGQARMPINLTFEMTHLCNLACYMCDLYGTGNDAESMRSENYRQNDLMDLSDYIRIVDDIKTFKPSISLTGGEPMLSPHTLDFIDYASRAGLVVTMTSNGYRLQEKASDLVASGLRNLTLSLDGVGAVHDDIRGKQGSFQNLKDGLEALNRQNSTLPFVQFNVTLCGRNQDRLFPLLEFAKEYQVKRIIFSHLWYWDANLVREHNARYGDLATVSEQNLQALENLDVRILSEELKKIKNSSLCREIEVKCFPDLSFDGMKTYYQDSLSSIGKYRRCLSPWMNTRILPNGDVIPCIDSFWGNLKKNNFFEIWNGDEAKRFRKALREAGTFPGCMRCCGLYSYS